MIITIEEFELLTWKECMNLYDNIVIKAKERGLDKSVLNYYTEKHHIFPKCLGGLDIEDNYVLVTFIEHITLHLLLTKLNPGNAKIMYAYVSMMRSNNGKRDFNEVDLNYLEKSRELNYLAGKSKENSKETRKKISDSRKGIKFSESTKQKLSDAHKGKQLSEDHKKKISNSLKGKRKGEVRSEEQRRKISRTLSTFKVQGPDGTIYNSLKEAGRAISRVKSTIKRWIEKFPDKGWKYYKED